MSCDACKSIFMSEVKLAPPNEEDSDAIYIRKHHKSIADLSIAARNHCRICGDVWRYFFHPTTPEQYAELPGFWNGTDINESTSGHVYFGSGTTWRLRKADHLKDDAVHADAVLLDFFINSPMNRDRQMFSYLIQSATRDDLIQLMSWQPQEQQSSSGGIAMIDGSFREKQRWDMVQKWMKECLCNHKSCNMNLDTDRVLPRRALYVPKSATDATTHYRLMSTRSSSAHQSTEYITLSHVWGVKSPPWMTTLANVDARMSDGIAVKDLPKTFRDAIEVTRRLGASLLWIDSLCIIQDDEHDKAKEVSNMTQIYMDSTLNLSATSASNSHEGLTSSIELHPRLTGTIWSGDMKGGNYRIMDLNFWQHRIADAKINSRGWVLQERCLAPRVLHFSFDQLVWECCELTASEEFPDSLPKFLGSGAAFKQTSQHLRASSIRHDASAVAHRKQVYDFWARCVMLYQRCDLTEASDKLVAIAGLARAVAGHLTNDVYIAGLWKNNLLSDLLWYVDNGRSRIDVPRAAGMYSSDYGSSSRPNEYRAPTWSWASVDGLVQHGGYLDCSGAPNPDRDANISSSIQPVATVRNFAVINASLGNAFGAVRDARLVVLGRLYRLKFTRARYTQDLQATFCANDDSVTVRLDEPADIADLESTYFLPLLYKHLSWKIKPDFLEVQEKVFIDSGAIYGINIDGSASKSNDHGSPTKQYTDYLSAELQAIRQPGYHDTVAGLVIAPTREGQAFRRIGMIETHKRKITKLDDLAGLGAPQVNEQNNDVIELCRPAEASGRGNIVDGTFKLV